VQRPVRVAVTMARGGACSRSAPLVWTVIATLAAQTTRHTGGGAAGFRRI
jgi:hypothetical protein